MNGSASVCRLAALGSAMVLAATIAVAAPAKDTGAAIEAGRKLFIRCTACHAVRADAPRQTGPHLEGIVGRRVASVPGFSYGASLRGQSFVWTRQRLDRWLQHPQRDFTDLCLPFTGLPRRKDRLDLIAFLEHPGR